MLSWVLLFVLIAVVAAYFGFGGAAALSLDIASLLFGLFVILLIAGIVVGGIRRAGRGEMP